MSNQITESHVVIYVAAESGYESNETFGTDEGNGSKALQDALREIVRLMRLNGETQTILNTVVDTLRDTPEPEPDPS
jgi:hypothetical protein